MKVLPTAIKFKTCKAHKQKKLNRVYCNITSFCTELLFKHITLGFYNKLIVDLFIRNNILFFEFIYFLLKIVLRGYFKKIDISCSSNSLCLVVSSWSSFLVFVLYFEKKNSSYNSINALLSSYFYLTLSIEMFFYIFWTKKWQTTFIGKK